MGVPTARPPQTAPVEDPPQASARPELPPALLNGLPLVQPIPKYPTTSPHAHGEQRYLQEEEQRMHGSQPSSNRRHQERCCDPSWSSGTCPLSFLSSAVTDDCGDSGAAP